MQNLYQICCLSEELLTECFGKSFDLPIDILKIAEYLNISIEEIDMEKVSNENTFRINYKLMQLSKLENIFAKENETFLYVEKSIPISSKRYVVAYGIAQYILHKDEKIYLRHISYCRYARPKKRTSMQKFWHCFFFCP